LYFKLDYSGCASSTLFDCQEGKIRRGEKILLETGDLTGGSHYYVGRLVRGIGRRFDDMY
jgi:hypothetical protein